MVDLAKAVKTPMQAAFSVMACSVIAFTLFPYLRDMNTPESAAVMTGLQWSAITGVVTPQAEVGTTGKKAFMRIAGTVFGGLSGFAGAELARAMPEAAALWVLVFSCAGAFVWKLTGQLVGYEYAGQIAAIATLLISWKGYTNPSISIPLLFVTRIGGICFGALVAQVSALVVFPTSAAQKLQEKMVAIVKLLDEQCELVWDAFCASGQEGAEPNLSDKFYLTREKSHDELRAIRELMPKAALERNVGKCAGGDCWMPGGCIGGRGQALDGKVALELITTLRAANRLVSTLFGVAYGDGRPRPDVVQVLHQQYRHEEDGGISALRKLRKDTQETWCTVGRALTKQAPAPESHKVSELIQAMLKQTKEDQRASLAQSSPELRDMINEGSPGKRGACATPTVAIHLLEDESYFQYRWYTFLMLYSDLAGLLDKVQTATSAWVVSLPQAAGAKKAGQAAADAKADPLQQPLLGVA